MSLHAVAAHFPLGALAASLLFDLLHAWTRREEFAHVGRWTLLLGTVFGAIALATGWVAERGVRPLPTVARTAVDLHSTLAYVTITLVVILCVARLAAGGRMGERWTGAYLAAASIAAALLVTTLYFGLRTVRVFAVGLPESTIERAWEARAPGEPADSPPILRDTVPGGGG